MKRRARHRVDLALQGGGAPFFSQVQALRPHRSDAEAEFAGLGAATIFNAAWPFVQRLHRIGRGAANTWLRNNFAHLGRRGPLSLEAYL
jgi:NTE family protein